MKQKFNLLLYSMGIISSASHTELFASIEYDENDNVEQYANYTYSIKKSNDKQKLLNKYDICFLNTVYFICSSVMTMIYIMNNILHEDVWDFSNVLPFIMLIMFNLILYMVNVGKKLTTYVNINNFKWRFYLSIIFLSLWNMAAIMYSCLPLIVEHIEPNSIIGELFYFFTGSYKYLENSCLHFITFLYLLLFIFCILKCVF